MLRGNKLITTYTHLLRDPDFDLDFLYGGRDSGKSYAIAQSLVHLCITEPYFRCVLVRKVFSNCKDSQWQLIKDIIEKMGMSEWFTFTKNPLEITCTLTGNKFIARGCENPQNLKSITNPSCCWIEEGNQLTEEDFTIIQSTLRCNDQRVRIFFSFNPEYPGDYTTFWLYKQWFSHTSALSFTSKKTSTINVGAGFTPAQSQNTNTNHTHYEIPPLKACPDFSSGEGSCKGPSIAPLRQGEVSFSRQNNSQPAAAGNFQTAAYTFRAKHTTYHTNPYVSPQCKAVYESYATSNSYYHTVYTLGQWGYRITGGEFWKQFSVEKHVRNLTAKHNLPMHVVIDNNVNPYVTVAIWQIEGKNL